MGNGSKGLLVDLARRWMIRGLGWIGMHLRNGKGERIPCFIARNFYSENAWWRIPKSDIVFDIFASPQKSKALEFI